MKNEVLKNDKNNNFSPNSVNGGHSFLSKKIMNFFNISTTLIHKFIPFSKVNLSFNYSPIHRGRIFGSTAVTAGHRSSSISSLFKFYHRTSIIGSAAYIDSIV